MIAQLVVLQPLAKYFENQSSQCLAFSMHKNKLQVLGCTMFSRVHFQNLSGQAAPYLQPLQQRDRGPIPPFLTVGLMDVGPWVYTSPFCPGGCVGV